MRDDPAIVALVERARVSDQRAWDELIERFAPLVWSICRRFRLTDADAHDVGQNVWLRLVEHLPALREPAALAGWLQTTTRRECIRVSKGAWDTERQRLDEGVDIPAEADSTEVDRQLIAAERQHALRVAFGQLGERCQELLGLLMLDPTPSYAEISGRLGMPIGAIGPNRARCIARLRRNPALAGLEDSTSSSSSRR